MMERISQRTEDDCVICVLAMVMGPPYNYETRWPWSERNSAHPMRGDERRAFFRCAIHVRQNHLTVPMQLFGSVRVVVDIDGRRLALFETQQGSWELTVVSVRGNDVLGSNLDRTRCDV